jgi:hypothetical protein
LFTPFFGEIELAFLKSAPDGAPRSALFNLTATSLQAGMKKGGNTKVRRLYRCPYLVRT